MTRLGEGDEESMQASLMEVINALARNTIDFRPAELILRALNAALRDARRVRSSSGAREMVRQIPDYLGPIWR